MNHSPENALASLVVILAIACNDAADSDKASSATTVSKSSTPRPRAGTPAPTVGTAGRKTGAASDAGAEDDEESVGDTDEAASGSAAPAPQDGAGGAAPRMRGTAGAAAAGRSAAAGTGGAGAAGANATPSVDRGPYFMSSGWQGYFWIAHHGAGTSITATNFTAATFAPPVCVKGTVAPTPDNSGNAMLGVNLNQARSIDASPLTATPTRAGVYLELTNAGGSPLRVEVQGLDGATNPASRWCATVAGTGGFIPWTQFNTACWDGSGSPYLRAPISTAIVMVPGTTDKAVAFDYCLFRLAEADMPVAATGAAGAASTARPAAAAGAGGAAGGGS